MTMISVTVRPEAVDSRRYILTIGNHTGDLLLDGVLDPKRILHPGQFGLDDTHMPADIWVPALVRFDSLATGESISVELDGYNIPAKYDGYTPYATLQFTRQRLRNAHPGPREELVLPVRMEWATPSGAWPGMSWDKDGVPQK